MTTILDHKAIDELEGSLGIEFTKELIETFLGEAPVMIAQMRQALAADDASGFRIVAHSLKSNAKIFGATDMAVITNELEKIGREGNLDIGDRLNVLEKNFSLVSAELHKLI